MHAMRLERERTMPYDGKLNHSVCRLVGGCRVYVVGRGHMQSVARRATRLDELGEAGVSRERGEKRGLPDLDEPAGLD